MNQQINYHICKIMSKRHNILPTIASFFMSSAGKKKGRAGVQNKVFRVADSLRVTVI